MGIPLCVICCFSLAAFNICSLCLIFVNLINMCLGVFPLGFILFGTLWVSWTWVIISFPILGKFSTIISSSIFSWSFFLSSSSGTPMIRMLYRLILSWRSLRLSSFLLIRFYFFLSDSFIYTILSSTSLILSSSSIILLFVPSRVFPMDRGAWWATVHGVAKSRTRLSDFTFTFHFHALEKEMATHSSILAWTIPRTEEPGGLPSIGSHRVGHD